MALLSTSAHAADTCDADIGINYPSPQTSYKVGNVIDVRISFGSGALLGGTKITFPSFAFDLGFDPTKPLTPPCTSDGPVISYNGDVTITTTCDGISWASNESSGTRRCEDEAAADTLPSSTALGPVPGLIPGVA